MCILCIPQLLTSKVSLSKRGRAELYKINRQLTTIAIRTPISSGRIRQAIKANKPGNKSEPKKINNY